MKLEKYPVTTDRQEYKVKVSEERHSYFGKYLLARVYMLGKSKILKKDKWKMVNEYCVDRDNATYIGRYVELAKAAVQDYEDWVKEQERKQNAHINGVTEWNSWDGKVV